MAVVEYFNGDFVVPGEARVPVEERGHQFGDGVYEVMRVYGGRAFLLDWHLERLERSLRVIGIESPHSVSEWTSLVGEAIRRSGEAEATVYLQVTRGIGPRAHLFGDAKPSVCLVVRAIAATKTVADASLLALPDERWANAYVKSINLLPNVIAKEVAHRHGAKEALLVRAGSITEGSSSNAWFVRDNRLFTAPANRFILGGVTRRFVLDLARECEIPVVESAVPLADLETVDEVFITSTTLEIQPVRQILVQPSMRAALQNLPQEAPTSLLPHSDSLDTLWTQRAGSHWANVLSQAFSDVVERFRSYEESPIR